MGKRVTKRQQRQFLELVAEDGNVTAAAEALGRNRATFYTIAERDEEFAKALKAARQDAIYGLEDRVLDWARNGFTIASQESVVDEKGKKVGRTKQKAEKRFDPRLALRVLERRHPDYKPKSDVDVSAKSGVLIVPGIMASEEDFDEKFGGG